MNAYYNYNNIPQENNNSLYQPAAVKPKKKSGGKIAALALCFSLLGGAVGTGGTYLALSNSGKTTSVVSSESVSKESEKDNKSVVLTENQNNTAVAQNAANKRTTMTASELYKANVNSTVGITTSINTNYYGYKTTSAASGSGFIISSDGYIVTNYHVVEDANKITVTLYDGKKYDAELIGSDESSDVAVLKIDADSLTPVTLGSSSELSVGDEVAAIGNPLGELTFSLTKGVVSALNRSVTIENKNMTLIQTDTAINSGNSGGALFNMYGEVVGITNARVAGTGSSVSSSSVDNLGFAIPIDTVKSIINSLTSDGYVKKPYIGIASTNVSEEQGSVSQGALIKTVADNSPAESAGLKVDDIITEVNGQQIKSSGELTAIVKGSVKGDKLVCKVYRDGSFTEVTITVGETTQDQSSSDKNTTKDQNTQKQDRSSTGDPFENYRGFGGFDGYGDMP